MTSAERATADMIEQASGLGATSDAYRLDDKYLSDDASVFLSGTQAMVRVVLDQVRRDRRSALRTAGFVSGYPGSPLAGFDQELGRQRTACAELDIVHLPGHNEELAATAVWGSQIAPSFADARHDGVVGVWYGKSPGLDRSGDAIRHAQYVGTDVHGGVLALVGDDPACKSSSLPNSSEHLLRALGVPTVVPGDIVDLLELGAHGISMSRATGLWTAMRVVTSVADATATVDLGAVTRTLPATRILADGSAARVRGIPGPPSSIEAEAEISGTRLVAAAEYGYEHGLNRISSNAARPWLAIAAVGHLYREVTSALGQLGLTEADLDDLGVRTAHIRMPYPLDHRYLLDVAAGVDEVIVVEEKRSFVETLFKEALYRTAGAPLILGKTDTQGGQFLASTGAIDADAIADVLARRLATRIPAERLRPRPTARPMLTVIGASRQPFFCSGCPHSTSTRVPAGALVGGGIGCHGMTQLMDESVVGDLRTTTHMGSEGAQWLGIAPFVSTAHMFQNIGDGTYFHSGQLAIQAAIAARANITYKLLLNDAIAMTGGQNPAESNAIPVSDLVHVLLRQGVKRIIVTTEDRTRYKRVRLPKAVTVWDRERIEEAQEILSAVPGVTVLIHDQRCAAETRRDRKRGKVEQPTTRVMIDHRVCEGCGDCASKANCLSLVPVDTEFGRKTAIAQSSCNLDMTCVQGDCPSFITVDVSRAERSRPPDQGRPDAATTGGAGSSAELPAPEYRGTDHGSTTIRMPGIGGTGVVTASQVLGTAATLDGLHTWGLDQTGLSQKAGPVVSDLRISREPIDQSNKAFQASVDVLLGFDLLGAGDESTLATLKAGRTLAVVSSTRTPTGTMVSHPDVTFPDDAVFRTELEALLGAERVCWVDAAAETERLLGDSSTANIFLVGVAFQFGALPMSAAGIERAIRLNAVAVESNLSAFRHGREWLRDQEPRREPRPDAASAADADGSGELPGIAGRIDHLADELVAYQSTAYSRRYRDVVRSVAEAEHALDSGSDRLTSAAAESLYKLMAYKDEYEVARLLLNPDLERQVRDDFGAGAKYYWNIHPPVLRSLGMQKKIKLGPSFRPVFSTLRRLKCLRGTVFDPFGVTHIRRTERHLVTTFTATLHTIVTQLDDTNFETAVELAGLPMIIRGYESVKMKNVIKYEKLNDELTGVFLRPVTPAVSSAGADR